MIYIDKRNKPDDFFRHMCHKAYTMAMNTVNCVPSIYGPSGNALRNTGFPSFLRRIDDPQFTPQDLRRFPTVPCSSARSGNVCKLNTRAQNLPRRNGGTDWAQIKTSESKTPPKRAQCSERGGGACGGGAVRAPIIVIPCNSKSLESFETECGNIYATLWKWERIHS